MESYIVRIYHRDQQDPAPVDGVVEIVRSGEKLAFHDSGELWRILASTEPDVAAGATESARFGSGRRRPSGR